MRPNPTIHKEPAGPLETFSLTVFQEEDTAQYFAEFTQRFMQCQTIEFKLLSKGLPAANKVARSLGQSISIKQVPEVIKKLASTQFRLRCESPTSNVPFEIFFNLYDDNIQLSCPDFLEEQVMSFFLAETDGDRK